MENKIISKLPRQVIIISLVSLFTDIASEMLYPIAPLFLAGALGASYAIVGIIEGFAEVIAGFLKGYFGRLSDKVRKRSIFVVIGYSLSALVKPLPGIAPAIGAVLTSRVFDRIGKGIRTAPRDALLASYAEGKTGKVFGFHRGMDTLGAAIGPALALLFLSVFSFSYQTIFLLAFIPSVLAIIFTLYVKDHFVEKEGKPTQRFSAFWKNSPRIYKIFLGLVTLFSLANSSDVFLILKVKSVSGSDTSALLSYIFYNIIYAGASYPAGILSDKIGKKPVFIAGLFLFSIVYAGFALSEDAYLFIPLFVVYGIYAASTEGISKALVSDLIPDASRGAAIGLLTMCSGFAVMLGSIGTGLLWDEFGSTVPFLASSALSAVVALMFLLFKIKENG